MNVLMLLEMAIEAFGDRVAIGRRDGSGLTYRQLSERAGAAATVFAASGKQRVVLIDDSSVALPVALFGAAWVGKPFVPLNYRLTAEAVRGLVDRLTPAVVIVNDETEAVVQGVDGVQTLGRVKFLESLEFGESAPSICADGAVVGSRGNDPCCRAPQLPAPVSSDQRARGPVPERIELVLMLPNHVSPRFRAIRILRWPNREVPVYRVARSTSPASRQHSPR